MNSKDTTAKPSVETLRLDCLQPFPGNPYRVEYDELQEMTESIRKCGIINPLVVRAVDTGYQIISGHRRVAAAHRAGLEEAPALVCGMDDDAAIIALVDSNMHREDIPPSVKAHAYKMKLDAIKRQGERTDLKQGKTRGQVGHKSRDDVAESESGRQVQRYVRLTELIPEILQMVDEGKIAMSPAVELSYLERAAQADLFEAMELEERTPSLAQAQRMRQLLETCRLDRDAIFTIMAEQKPNQTEQLKLKTDSIKGFFPRNYTIRQMEEVIMRLLADWQRQRERAARNRDAR